MVLLIPIAIIVAHVITYMELKKKYNENQINENLVLKGISCNIELGKFII